MEEIFGCFNLRVLIHLLFDMKEMEILIVVPIHDDPSLCTFLNTFREAKVSGVATVAN